MAYWKAKNTASPTKFINALVGDSRERGLKNPEEEQDPITRKIDEKVEEKVDEVVNQKTNEGLV